jgi:ATP citrate (pro-S)-lyase
MAQKPIREYDGKRLLAQFWSDLKPDFIDATNARKICLVQPERGVVFQGKRLLLEHEWMNDPQIRFVAKPDQLVKRRGELGLVKLNLTFQQAAEWISQTAWKETTIEGVVDDLHTFLLEPFVPHDSNQEYYVSFQNVREGTLVRYCFFIYFYFYLFCFPKKVYFYHEGGVKV